MNTESGGAGTCPQDQVAGLSQVDELRAVHNVAFALITLKSAIDNMRVSFFMALEFCIL
jgi:hypothetical protein